MLINPNPENPVRVDGKLYECGVVYLVPSFPGPKAYLEAHLYADAREYKQGRNAAGVSLGYFDHTMKDSDATLWEKAHAHALTVFAGFEVVESVELPEVAESIEPEGEEE